MEYWTKWVKNLEMRYVVCEILNVKYIFCNCLVNSLRTNVLHHIETSQLIGIADQLTGFYMMGNIGP